ncbi:MAG: ABC transporter [endosymbiont of Galathealinum brachiosum]|uniref:ABC transporter n=1 Tax=endosymbiont of Galathealinum brachiosum TaxID=2200906 RepID=A0A370DFD1_9GAMM|nr:MAG: ABC transporter [endosymbiont of Galathealinum brachiosum]
MIHLKSANVAYKGKTALSDITLHVSQGEKLALVGRSGSGKSTLLNLLYETTDKLSNDTAFVPQEYGLVQNLSVYHNVYMGQLGQHSTLYNLINLMKPFSEQVEQVSDILKNLQLSEKLFEPVAQLSGGQQQRTAIARALMHNGHFLLADEPVSSLDEMQSLLVMNLLCKQFDTIIFSLHDVDLALKFCDRIIGLDHGRVVIDDRSENLNRQQLLKLYEE